MKRGSGIQVREDRSSGIEILISEDFAKINPTEPLRLSKQAVPDWSVDYEREESDGKLMMNLLHPNKKGEGRG